MSRLLLGMEIANCKKVSNDVTKLPLKLNSILAMEMKWILI